jgi:hypothetical protein
MSEKTCATLLFAIFTAALCTLGLFAPSSRHLCNAGSVEALFTPCEKVAIR